MKDGKEADWRLKTRDLNQARALQTAKHGQQGCREEETMRWFQIALFVLGTASMIGSAFGIGKSLGETMFNTGIAFLLIDLVCMQLWPSAKRV